MKQAVKIFKALSDSTRVRMIKLLETAGELCVCEILRALDISQTRASRNLNILKHAGLVTDRRKGMWVHYSINCGGSDKCCADIYKIMRTWLNREPQIRQDLSRLKKFRSLK